MNIKSQFPEIFLKLMKNYSIEELKNLEFNLRGMIAFADISGFTSLSEILMGMGFQGSEILNKILNFYYGKMINILKKHNGDLLSFAGDALNIFFKNKENAINSALEIQNFFKKNSETETPFGKFPISIKIGLSGGNLKFYLLKEGDFLNLVFEGEALNKAAEAEHHSSPGDITIYEDGFFAKVNKKTEEKKSEEIISKDANEEKDLLELFHPFFREAFIKKQTIFLNSHINCVVIFINLEGANLKEIYRKTSIILKKYNGYFLKVDCGDKGDKFLILFGVPFQIEKPLHKAFDFLLDFKELSLKDNFNFKAGINYSKIFAGFLGSNERCEYTVLGDGVNLSARLMQIAEKNEIISLKEVSEKVSDEFYFKLKPPVQLKGKKGTFILYELSEKRTYKPPITYFYGRKKELLELLENFKENGFFLIYGEMGCGKTTFTTYFLDKYLKRPFYYVNCSFSEKEIPYNSLKKFLDIYINVNYKDNKPEKYFEEFFNKNLPQIKDYLNIFLNIFFNLNLKEPELEAEYKKGIIYKILSEFLKYESKNNEICLFLDNGHNIDSLSFEFLKSFFKNEVWKNFKAILNDREKKDGFEYTLELKNFEKEETQIFLKGFLKVFEIPKDFLSKIYKNTNGNPLLLKETISACISSGYILINEEYQYVLNLDPLKEPPLSDNLENIILMKLDNLNFDEKNFIKNLSIYGNKIDLKIFPEIRKEDAKIKNLSEFILHKDDFLYFIDENFQRIIYDNLEFNFKKNEHLKIGDYLFEKMDEKNPLKNFQLAYHYGKAEDKKALRYLSEISKERENLYDLKGAINFLENFLKISDKNNLFFDEETLRLSNLYIQSGIPEKGIKILKEKENLLKKENLPKYFLNLSNSYKSIGEFKLAIDYINEGLNSTNKRYDLFLLNVQMGRILGQMGKLREAKEKIEDVYKNFKDFKNEKEYYTILTYLGYFKIQKGNANEAIKLYKYAIKFFKKNNHLRELLNSYINISSAIYANFIGDYEMALKYSIKAYNLALKYCFFELEALLKLEHNLSLWYLLLGNFKKSKEYFQKAISKGKNILSDYVYFCFCTKAKLNLETGNFIEFKEDIQKAEEMADKLRLFKDPIYQLNLYYYYLKKEKRNYYQNLKEYENLITREKMEYIKPEILNFKAEGSILFDNQEKNNILHFSLHFIV